METALRAVQVVVAQRLPSLVKGAALGQVWWVLPCHFKVAVAAAKAAEGVFLPLLLALMVLAVVAVVARQEMAAAVVVLLLTPDVLAAVAKAKRA
jgi:hypothetical protein